MSRFNIPGHRAQPPVARATSPMGTTSPPGAAPSTRTFEGGAGWRKDVRTDLFLRTTSSFLDGSGSFYESGKKRDEILERLVRQLAVEDFDWVYEYARWLRGPGNMRTAALMVAAIAVKARLEQEKTDGLRPGPCAADRAWKYTSRQLIDVVCQRADEPGELLAYWLSAYGKGIPKPVKRGVGDAVRRLCNERSLLKYDTSTHAVRFGDVLEICHPAPDPDKAAWQGDLFQHAIDRRQGHTDEIPASLEMIQCNADLRARADTADWLAPENVHNAGMTWEDVLSAVGGKVSKAKLWESVIPSMGYMALLRNLRNFDEAGISNQAANEVIVRLVQEDQVRKSRQLPFRFYSAYKAAPSLRWGHALETALDLCLPNIPELSGRTLVLIDTSASMEKPVSGKSALKIVETAALFGAALALKNPTAVDLYQFATGEAQFAAARGGSVLKLTTGIMNNVGRVGHGTDIGGAVQRQYRGHDRIVILTDGQGARGGGPANAVASCVPNTTPVYLFNVESYSASPMPTGSAARFDLGGLTDATFALIPRLEAGLSGVWPWEMAEA